MKLCGIYIIKSPTGKVYIGQSVNIKKRINYYKNNGAKEQPFLNNSFIKHGFENHVFDILIECERKKLNDYEQKYIEMYQSFNTENGMNLTSGGCQNWVISEETRTKMKNRIRLPHSKETKEKMSIASKGKKKNYSSRLGIKLSEETKSKIKQNHSHSKPMLGKTHSEKAKKKISLAHKGRIAHNRRPIIDINTGVIYSHKKEAADTFGIKVRTLKAKLEGKLKNNTTLIYA